MQTLRRLGEVSLIARLRRRIGPGHGRGTAGRSSVLVGLGDDAAVLRLPAPGRVRLGGVRQAAGRDATVLLFASDMLVEGVHFRLPVPFRTGRQAGEVGRHRVPAWHIGWKALACNVSDIAAMGGIPRWAVVSLGIPPNTPVPFVDGLYDGLTRCARRYGVAIVGGDTVRAPRVVVDVAIIGTVRRSQLVLRSGARVGDLLYVTGRLGGSYRSGRHARFPPRVQEAQTLGARLRLHAMIDLSDGLASDLWQISRASRVALRVEASKIPVSRAGRTCLPARRHARGGAGRRRFCPCRRWPGPSPIFHALMDGEDFELLFAVGPRDAAQVPARIGSCPVTRIGRAVGRGVRVELERADGRVEPLIPQGFRHW